VAQPSELERLAGQRRRLIAESDALRGQLAEEVAALQRSTSWIERALALAQSSRAIWPILAGLAGLLLARASGGLFGRAGKMLSWWRLTKKLAALWHSFKAQQTPAKG
jgi:hypothetical protein